MSDSRNAQSELNNNPFIDVEEVQEIEVSVSRGSGAASELTGVENPDMEIVQLELADGMTWISSPSQYQEDYPEAVNVKNGSTYSFDVPEGSRVDADRGVIKNVLSKLVRVKLKDAAEKSALKLTQKLEDRLKPEAGIYKIENPTRFLAPAEKSDFKSGEPSLLLIHGTGSSTEGSFKPFILPATQETDIEDLAYWNSLTDPYNGRVFALEHRSLSKSPLENAIDFLKVVPHGSRIHLLSHSRGGLVGEILSRANIDGQSTAFSKDEIGVFERAFKEAEDKDRKAALNEEIEMLAHLNALIGEKELNVERFVRVACPASGTNLMMERADVFLNVLLNAIGLIPPLKTSMIYNFLKAFLMEVVKNRFKPEVLPGLAAQQPTSPLVRVLNNPNVKLNAELAVIAGNSNFSSVLKKLVVFVSRLVFWEHNDLVVHTRSMLGGAERTKAWVYFKDDSPNISHFRYFKNEDPRKAIRSVLLEGARPDAPFAKIDEDVRSRKRGAVKQGGRPIDEAPVVFVLPGIMGSVLSAESQEIWVKKGALMWGGISKLTMNSDSVVATSLMESHYGDLVDYFGDHYHVIPFAYDWRQSISNAAKRLSEAVSDALEKTEHRVTFIAHSMGGLVVRKMIATRPDLWKQVTDRSGRLIMMGTPNEGSYSVLRTLMGQNKKIKYMGMLDVKNTAKDILKIIREYDGFLELLPRKKAIEDGTQEIEVNYFDRASWSDFESIQTSDVFPKVTRLKAAKKLSDGLRNNDATLDPQHMVYVAGQGKATAASVEIEDGTAQFMSTKQGDGTVTWKSGIAGRLEDVTYYMAADHGNMPRSKADFPALLDLLNSGSTARLPKQPNVSRGDEPDLLELLAEEDVEFLPDESWLEDAMLEASSEEIEEVQGEPVEVSVALGNLAHGKYPIVVGHYAGDAILHAENVLDYQLDRRLSDFKDMGLYPGEPETSLVVLNEGNTPSGGIIVGLGKFGELSQDKLIRSLQHGLISYAMKWCQSGTTEDDLDNDASTEDREDGQQKNRKADEPLGISPLLIGASTFSGLSTRSSIRAVLMAVQNANERISEFNKDNRNRVLKPITKVEFIELYEDQAIQIMHTLKTVLDKELEGVMSLKYPHVRELEGGRRRLHDLNMDWWHRIKIAELPDYVERVKAAVEAENNQSPDFVRLSKDIEPPLQFTLLTGRARAEESTTLANRKAIRSLLDGGEIVSGSKGSISKALFELLLPNAFKEFLMDRHNLVLVLDDAAAVYPWEMLSSGEGDLEDPIALRGGMVRQLVTEHYREKIEGPMKRTAFVIGNPRTHMVNLPAASDEARMVANMLEDFSFNVESLFDADATPQAIISTLFNSEYRILHLAGHGLFEYGPEKETGMVIGEHLILTPGTIKQMRHVPDVAFLNCCYLGSAKDDEKRSDRHRIAANLGTQLIRMGVRCVVAAGWEVNDRAAKRFAEVFYEKMLSGDSFGEAVKGARKATHVIAPESNTWGAYQCYGDPSYRLFNQGGGNSTEQRTFVSPEEPILELSTLVSRAQDASERYFKVLQGRLRETIQDIPEEWNSQARVVEAIANACGELELFEEAIKYYNRLSGIEKATYTLKSLETKANLEARVALAKWITPDADNEKEKDELRAQALIEVGYALDFLHFITDTHEQFTTAERCSLVGSAYKCLSVMRSEKEKDKKQKRSTQLIMAAEYYAKAYKKKSGRGPDMYSGLNWLSIELLLKTFYPGAKLEGLEKRNTSKSELKHMLEAIKTEALEAGKREPSFWNLIAEGDFSSYRYLEELLKKSEPMGEEEQQGHQAKIINAYYKAWKRGGTYMKRNSILRQFTWLINIMEEIQKESPGATAKNGKKLTVFSKEKIESCVANLKSVKVALQARLSDQ